jgi:hypothetical protein
MTLVPDNMTKMNSLNIYIHVPVYVISHCSKTILDFIKACICYMIYAIQEQKNVLQHTPLKHSEEFFKIKIYYQKNILHYFETFRSIL